jgi:hypothetical protein
MATMNLRNGILAALVLSILTMLASSEFTALAVVVTVLLPFAAGASEAIQSGKVLVGTRAGFWSGMSRLPNRLRKKSNRAMTARLSAVM